MKKLLNYQLILILALSAGLSGCGKKNKKHTAYPPNPNGNTQPYDYFDDCSMPNFGGNYNSEPPRRVQGVIGNGAIITLDLYQGSGNSYYAMGQIEIASIEELYGYNTGRATPFSSCLSTKTPGSISGGVYGDISMVLVGKGVEVTLGQAPWGGITTYIREGDQSAGELMGNIYLTIANHGNANTPFFMGPQ